MAVDADMEAKVKSEWKRVLAKILSALRGMWNEKLFLKAEGC